MWCSPCPAPPPARAPLLRSFFCSLCSQKTGGRSSLYWVISVHCPCLPSQSCFVLRNGRHFVEISVARIYFLLNAVRPVSRKSHASNWAHCWRAALHVRLIQGRSWHHASAQRVGLPEDLLLTRILRSGQRNGVLYIYAITFSSRAQRSVSRLTQSLSR